MYIPSEILELERNIRAANGKLFIVGGYVRDYIFRSNNLIDQMDLSKDIDLEVFYISQDVLESIIAPYNPKFVGKIYGVYDMKIGDWNVNISLPRSDRKAKNDWDIKIDPNMSIYLAATRRDFTINALMYDIQHSELFDMFECVKHIDQRKLVIVDDITFEDDPLRVLRAFSLASRFNLTADPRTVKYMSQMMHMYREIPKERLWIEWEKWSNSRYPTRGLNILEETDWINFYPQISIMRNVPQDHEWHPEGDVWTHTKFVVMNAAKRGSSVVFAALLHDTGKAATTITRKRISSLEHSIASAVMARFFMDSIGAPYNFRDKIVELVRYHMYKADNLISFKKLKAKLQFNTIPELVELMISDQNGRPPLPLVSIEDFQQIMYFNEIAEISPIVMGRHLIDAGYKPGPEFKNMLDYAYSLQLEEKFDTLEDGIKYVRRHFPNS